MQMIWHIIQNDAFVYEDFIRTFALSLCYTLPECARKGGIMSKESMPSLEMLLRVGDMVLVQPVRKQDTGIRCKAHVIGWEPREYLLLESSPLDSNVQFIRRGTQYITRFVSEGRVCGFHSASLETQRWGDKPYFRVQWPDGFETVQIRQHERISMNQPCRLSGEDSETDGYLCDVILSGYRVISPDAYPMNAIVRLSFTLSDGTPISLASGKIKNVTHTHRECMLGIAFMEEDLYLRGELAFYLATAYGRQRVGVPRSKTVLLIADSDPSHKALASNLHQNGYPAILAHSVVDGLGRLRASVPDLLLIQTNINPIPGKEICAMIRSDMAYQTLPIFLFGPEMTESTAKASGADEHFPSLPPFEDIVSRLERMCRTHSPSLADETQPIEHAAPQSSAESVG